MKIIDLRFVSAMQLALPPGFEARGKYRIVDAGMGVIEYLSLSSESYFVKLKPFEGTFLPNNLKPI
ncbi:hypothetical protein [Saccharicrinis sp. GN24d3]|uniref:hypothetical protein n=1 Tax=Saccharicrinis sp. GN24d3 TaxID=3458416 RepID=UPI00403528D5